MTHEQTFHAKACAMTKWHRVFLHVAPATVALVIGALAIMILDRNLPQEIVWGKIIPPSALPGEPVKFHFGLKKYTEYSGTVKRWVTDVHGQVFPLSNSSTVSDQIKSIGVEQEITKDFSVPCGMAAGSAAYHSTAYLHSWWNVAQWIYPVSHDIAYSFIVKNGSYGNVCAVSGGAGSGEQGIQGDRGATGAPGAPGAPGAGSGKQGIQGERGATGAAAPIVERPRIIHKTWIEPSVIKAGDKFTLHSDVTINQICPGESHWSVVHVSDGIEVATIIHPTKLVVLGFNRLSNVHIMPSDILPGDYYYTAMIYEFCGPDRTTFVATTEHIPFTVK